MIFYFFLPLPALLRCFAEPVFLAGLFLRMTRERCAQSVGIQDVGAERCQSSEDEAC